MAEEDLPLPLEIPWRLGSTTQPLVAGAPDQTSISLFFHEPKDEVLTSKVPDARLIYLKFTVSVSPASFPSDRSQVAATFLGEGIPCFHLLLDLRARNGAGDLGTIRPYFHAAAPLYRRMIQTGVIGGESYEGEADGQFMGKSGSQMYETQSTQSKTFSAGGGVSFGIGPFSIGGSARSTTTDVTSDRSVSQVLDTTTREASQERRELASHTTSVENLLTLLNTKSVGTPYLSFSLAPQPLQLLSIDPSDPNLWFNQLLTRRSSGIEGIQEFTAVLVVPRGQDFCVNARLRRVCLLDSPPGPFALEERLDPNLSLIQLARMVDYLYRLYPIGTPLEELDLDLIGALAPNPSEFRRPVIELWAFRLLPRIVEAIVASPHSSPGAERRGSVNYKHFLELWLEMLRFEYEQEVSRSPLERGVLVGENRHLETCFTRNQDGSAEVSSSSASVSPLVRVPIDFGEIDIGGVQTLSDEGRASVRTRAFETVTRWNALEKQLASLLEHRRTLPEQPVSVEDPRVVSVLIDRWSKLSQGDQRNLNFEAAADLLHLSDAQRRRLKAAGATDLRSIARAIKLAPVIERHNAEARRLGKTLEGRKEAASPPEEISLSLSMKHLAEIREAIGAGLGRDAGRGRAGG
jgi:hypothetical protein